MWRPLSPAHEKPFPNVPAESGALFYPPPISAAFYRVIASHWPHLICRETTRLRATGRARSIVDRERARKISATPHPPVPRRATFLPRQRWLQYERATF